ncbi:probable U3 small nucleolar RNA-associated protein 11 [Haliotis cracherodii]|uniref:probable U3 small nucleolar RNA-associated protein 11 n=1 Tax=Haliotis cracherodii TaxID=6455 RepID=UPI0039EA7DDB
MASFTKANKSMRRTYKERSQLESRAKLGMLEKKKDYKERADDFQRKQRTLKALKRKAEDRNPDEFYFNMVKTQKVDGVHQRRESSEPMHTEDQLKLMETQDLRYVNFKRFTEKKKVEKLKSSLHLIDCNSKPKNKHIVFVDSKKEAKNFDPAKHFDTHPAFVNRAYNRPTRSMLESLDLSKMLDEETLQDIAVATHKRYSELGKRIERERDLSVVADKMETKIHLMDKEASKEKVKDETKTAPAQYRWKPVRKR